MFQDIRVLRCVLDYHYNYYINSGTTTKDRHSVTASLAKEILTKAVECVKKRNEIMQKISSAGVTRENYSDELTKHVYAITTVIVLCY